ncbi:hypothetical protein NQZ68_007222 [Dissostichus eleginoides]|nr:hypothetical protein NQZ68_007222 [Dissostichus eleginoides]
MVRWKKRDSEGNLIFARPRSTRNDSNQAIAPETVDLQQSLSDTTGDEVVAQIPSASLLASTNWSTRELEGCETTSG